MDNKSNKHAQVPDKLYSEHLRFGDKLVYANIRKYANKETLKCYPRVDTIAADCGFSVKTVTLAIKRLQKAGLLKVTPRKGTSSMYEFEKLDDGFERFSEDFLKLNISPQAKAYYIEIQQHLFLNKEQGTNETTYSNEEIGKRIGLCTKSVRKYNTELIQAGILSETKLSTLDLGGVRQIKKSFDLYTLGQAMVYKLKEHDVQLQEHDQAIKNLEAENEQMRSRIKALERLCGLQNNEFVQAKEFSF